MQISTELDNKNEHIVCCEKCLPPNSGVDDFNAAMDVAGGSPTALIRAACSGHADCAAALALAGASIGR